MSNLVGLSLMTSDKKVFKDFNLFLVLLPWQPECLKESNSFKKNYRGPWQEHFCEISSKSDKYFLRRCFKKKLTNGRMDTQMDGCTNERTGRQTIGHDKLPGLWPVEVKSGKCFQIMSK